MRSMLHDYRDASAASVEEETANAIRDADALVDGAIASLAAPSFDATLRPIDLAWARAAEAYGRGAFLGQVSTSADIRAAGHAADERLTKWRVALASRRELYEAVAAFAATPEGGALTGERQRLLDFWLRDFRRAGQGLAEPVRHELSALRERLVELEVTFGRNVNEWDDGIDVGPEQLDGLPASYVERLSPGSRDGTWRVSLDSPELVPFLEQSPDRDARHDLFLRLWSRAVEANRPLLEEAIRIRHRMARLHGKPSWAEHALEVKMAARPDRVRAFYDEILPAVSSAAGREADAMQSLLEQDGEVGPLAMWDWRFYDYRQRRDEHGVDSALVSEHLPLDRVLGGLFSITAEVFGLRYRRVEDAAAWHPSVELYEIMDATSGATLAYFYTDLFPRADKYSHAAAFPLVVGHRRADGAYRRPVSAIVANLTPPDAGHPSLLRHEEVETIFHEFGHILHMSLTRAECARFSGAETEWDFVEAPSQIMEHWTWEPAVLNRFARHHLTDEPMPESLVASMAAARNLNAGLRAAIQVFYGTMDLAIHDGEAEPDLDRITRSTYEVTRLGYPDGTFLLASFGHLMGGYDAGYYGYLWAEALGDDMWARFEHDGILSPTVGMAYRRAILEPNGSRSGDEMFEEFVGRAPSTEAWLREKGFRP
jgi:Zn-dependent oligopeptidase